MLALLIRQTLKFARVTPWHSQAQILQGLPFRLQVLIQDAIKH